VICASLFSPKDALTRSSPLPFSSNMTPGTGWPQVVSVCTHNVAVVGSMICWVMLTVLSLRLLSSGVLTVATEDAAGLTCMALPLTMIDCKVCPGLIG